MATKPTVYMWSLRPTRQFISRPCGKKSLRTKDETGLVQPHKTVRKYVRDEIAYADKHISKYSPDVCRAEGHR